MMHSMLAVAWLAISGVGLAAPNGRERIESYSCPNSQGGAAATSTSVADSSHGATGSPAYYHDGSSTMGIAAGSTPNTSAYGNAGGTDDDDQTPSTNTAGAAVPGASPDVITERPGNYDAAPLNTDSTTTTGSGEPIDAGQGGDEGNNSSSGAVGGEGTTGAESSPNEGAEGSQSTDGGSTNGDSTMTHALGGTGCADGRESADASTPNSNSATGQNEAPAYAEASHSEPDGGSAVPSDTTNTSSQGDSTAKGTNSSGNGDYSSPATGTTSASSPESSPGAVPSNAGTDGASSEGTVPSGNGDGTDGETGSSNTPTSGGTNIPGYGEGTSSGYPTGQNTSTGGGSKKCDDPPTSFHLSDSPYENYFYSDCNVAAQVVVTSPEPESNLTIIGPRMVVAWPAGNSGAVVFFTPQNGVNGTLSIAIDNQTSSNGALQPVVLPAPAGSEYPSVGVSGVFTLNDSAVLTLPILGSKLATLMLQQKAY